MLSFEWPWVLALLPLPWLVRRLFAPVQPGQGSALRVPFLREVEQAVATAGQRRVRRPALWLAIAAWGFSIVAGMRPTWVGDMQGVPASGRDLMLAVDLSRSMAETDFELKGEYVDRLTATKHVAADFIERRAGDRIGLIVFGEQAYLHVPLTFDRKTVLTLLDEAVIGLAGKATAIGDAIGLAVKRLRNQHDGEKVLILLTDGASNAGAIEPLRAAELASQNELKIYTIGIGSDSSRGGLFGPAAVAPSAELDEDTLRSVARMTGGRYFRARDIAELEKIYSLIDEIEPVSRAGQYLRPRSQLFYYPLAASLALAALIAAAGLRGTLRA